MVGLKKIKKSLLILETPKFFVWLCLREVPRLCGQIIGEQFHAVLFILLFILE
jgi:hypothetical protein